LLSKEGMFGIIGRQLTQNLTDLLS